MFKQTSLKNILFILAILLVIALCIIFVLPYFFKYEYVSSENVSENPKTEMENISPKLPEVSHLPTPNPVKAIYMSACAVGTKTLRDSLVKIADETEVNSIVIDVKDYSGTLSFKPQNPDIVHAWDASKCGATDMKEFIETLHKKNIYAIARVTVFQDPHFTKMHPELAVQSASTKSPWKDRKGLNFLDVGGKATWEYVMKIVKDSYDIGFDEINFDYIRYPSDGNMKDTVFTLSIGTKADQLEKFFSYLREETKKIGVVTSADLFGMTTTNTDDLNIGQVLEKAMPYFDYIAPMVYPSHYPPNFNGWKNPNEHVYDLIHFVMESAVRRAGATTTVIQTLGSQEIFTEKNDPATGEVVKVKTGLWSKEVYSADKLRTWIQDFNYGGTYGVPEVKAEIKASNDVGVRSWMIWSPSNKYTVKALGGENI